MKQLKVLYLIDDKQFRLWGDDVMRAVSANHDIRVFDLARPVALQFQDIDVIIDASLPVTQEMYDHAGNVRFWQIASMGLDHADLDKKSVLGIPIANFPGQLSSVALADLAMMFILILARQFRQSVENFKAGVYYEPMGRELERWKLGIVGFGSSGIELARRAKAFGMDLLVLDNRDIEPEVLHAMQPEFIGSPQDLDYLVRESDVLSLHLPLNKETHHIIDARRLHLMKSTAYLINIARGSLVDETSLYEMLKEGKLAGAGLDVYSTEPPDLNHPLFSLPNVITTPHIAGATDGTARRRADFIAQNIDRVACGQEPLNRCDLDKISVSDQS